MRRWIWAFALVFLAGLFQQSVSADPRLKITGFIDNHIRATQNLSNNDDNLTRLPLSRAQGDEDETMLQARSRARMFFNIEAFENTKGVVAFEFDQTWGNRGDSGTAGFDFGTDNNAFELKHLYVDFKVPQTPVELRIGGFSHQATRLKNLTLLHMDLAGIGMTIPFSPQFKTYTWFAWTGEGFDGLEGVDSGDDYAVGTTLQTTFLEGLDVDFVFAFQRVECQDQANASDCPNQTLRVGRVATDGDSLLSRSTARTEERFYLGIDARWKYGPLTLSPTFIYQFGTRQTQTGGELDIRAFLLDVRAQYKAGPFTGQIKFAYTRGNDANERLENGDTINFYQQIATDTVNRSTDWFEILGFNLDTTHEPSFGFYDTRSIRSSLTFDQFGLIHGAARGDFKVTDKVTVTGALGFFAADKNVGRPSRLGADRTQNADFNYTGNDRYLGTEIDAWMRYQIFPRTSVDLWFAYAFIGDALNLRNAADNQTFQAEDVIMGGTRMIYRF